MDNFICIRSFMLTLQPWMHPAPGRPHLISEHWWHPSDTSSGMQEVQQVDKFSQNMSNDFKHMLHVDIIN